MTINNIKVAIVHDWLTGMRGGEKCLDVFCELFPNATVYTLVHEEGSVSPTIEKMDIRTSFLQKLPNATKRYRNYLPLFPKAIESFDLSSYELVLSSSHCVAKGAKAPDEALHLCYCYTPVRYAWKFFDQYFGKEKGIKKAVISFFIERLKRWDLLSNKRVDRFVAISEYIRDRIKFYYDRESDVIYPPVDIPENNSAEGDDGYYLIVSAMVPYKKVDLAVRAFSKNKKRLVVIGNGPDLEEIKSYAGSNIEFHGWMNDVSLKRYFQRCSALVFPGEEDFGIVPVEAQAYGKPVLAYAAGGALETVNGLDRDAPTGVFFNEQTEDAINLAVDKFESVKDKFDTERAKENAMKFSRERFKREIKEYIENKWDEHKSRLI